MFNNDRFETARGSPPARHWHTSPLLVRLRLVALVLAMVATVAISSNVAQQSASPDANRQAEQPVSQPSDAYPYYLQSPLDQTPQQQPAGATGAAPKDDHDDQLAKAGKQLRTIIMAPHMRLVSGPRGLPLNNNNTPASVPQVPNLVSNNYQYEPTLTPKPAQQQSPSECLYDKRYFLKLDQCLERKPYPTIGLAAFKNEDLLIRKGLSDKYGCSFILSNGHFKNFAISKYALNSDTQCLDQDQTSQLSLQFSNVSLYYLWQLRCLNYANQLLDDATLDGKTLSNGIYPNEDDTMPSSVQLGAKHEELAGSRSICVGSSQSFGFAALQLSSLEAQVELSIDIYKNWRVTNVTVAMISPGLKLTEQQIHSTQSDYGHDYSTQPQPQQQQYQTGEQRTPTGIKDFTFDTIDGDELNWRYSHLYENWTRNRLHVNFLDQFKRFLWVSLQRCLSESSEKLPIKLNDMFGNHKYI